LVFNKDFTMSTRIRASVPEPPDDPTLSAITAALAGLPKPERDAFIAFYHRWRSLTNDRRAAFAKIVWPDMRDCDVAELVGVRRRSLYRMNAFMAAKPRMADFKAARPKADSSRRRRGFSNPADPFA
jgi:hypothetical protein